MSALNVVKNRARLADKALGCLQCRDLAQWRPVQILGLIVRAETCVGQHLFEFDAFFHHRQFRHIVVVAGGKAMELDHVVFSSLLLVSYLPPHTKPLALCALSLVPISAVLAA